MVFETIFNQFNWANEFLWNFSTLVKINERNVHGGNSEVAVIQCQLEHAGTQVLQYLPAGAQLARFNDKRNLQLQRVGYWGVKDKGGMRGSPIHPQRLMDYAAD